MKMKQDSSTISWNNMGEEWLELASNNSSRNLFIMPNMIKYIGDCKGMTILDLGSGDGGYSRELSSKGAFLTAVDCSEKAINFSTSLAFKNNLNIKHFLRNSNDLFDIENDYYDIVLCSMMLMDCEDLFGTLKEAYRVLKPNGHLYVSILHPCFDGNHQTGIGRLGVGKERNVLVMNYFEPQKWEAPLYGGKTSVVWRHHTLEEYVKTFVRSGFTIEDLYEPRATDEEADLALNMNMLNRIPLYLYWKLKK